MTMIFPTKVGDIWGEYTSVELASTITPDPVSKTTGRGIFNLRSLVNAGLDPFGLVIDRVNCPPMTKNTLSLATLMSNPIE